MKLKTRTTLIAGAIAALLAGPTWAESYTPNQGAQNSAPNAEIGQPERYQPKSAQPMSETPRMDATTYGGATATTPIGGSSDAGGGQVGGAAAATPVGDNPLYARSAADLERMDVVDSTGNTVGKVKQIVLAPDRKSAHAMITVGGGSLGFGARDIMVSLDELKPMGNKLQMSATKGEIAARKDGSPCADMYVEVKGKTPISGSIVEFSAFEQGKEGTKPSASEQGMEADKPGATSSTPKSGATQPLRAPATPKELQ